MTRGSGGWMRSYKSETDTVCYSHLPYFDSTLRNRPPPLAVHTILLVQSQRPQESCQRRRLHWLKPRSQTDPGSEDASVGGTFFFSCLFFEPSIGAFRKVCQTTSVALWNSCLQRCGGRAHTSGFSDSLESVKRMTLVLLLALNSQRHGLFWRADEEMEGWVEERWEQLLPLFFSQHWFHTFLQGIFSQTVCYVLAPHSGVRAVIPAIFRANTLINVPCLNKHTKSFLRRNFCFKQIQHHSH